MALQCAERTLRCRGRLPFPTRVAFESRIRDAIHHTQITQHTSHTQQRIGFFPPLFFFSCCFSLPLHSIAHLAFFCFCFPSNLSATSSSAVNCVLWFSFFPTAFVLGGIAIDFIARKCANRRAPQHRVDACAHSCISLSLCISLCHVPAMLRIDGVNSIPRT